MYTLMDSRKLKSASEGEEIVRSSVVRIISSMRSLRVSLTSKVDSELVSTSGVSMLKGKFTPAVAGTTAVSSKVT